MVQQGKIKLHHATVNQQKVIRIDLPLHIEAIANRAKALKDRKWDKERQFLYVPNKKEHLKDIFSKFKGLAWVDGKAFFDKTRQQFCQKTHPKAKSI